MVIITATTTTHLTLEHLINSIMETPMHLIITTIIIRMIITTTTTTMVIATITKELISIIMDKMEVT